MICCIYGTDTMRRNSYERIVLAELVFEKKYIYIYINYLERNKEKINPSLLEEVPCKGGFVKPGPGLNC